MGVILLDRKRIVLFNPAISRYTLSRSIACTRSNPIDKQTLLQNISVDRLNMCPEADPILEPEVCQPTISLAFVDIDFNQDSEDVTPNDDSDSALGTVCTSLVPVQLINN